MRPGQQNKRSRGRNNNAGGGRRHGNPLSRNFESNGPDVKVRGNAAHIAEKYVQLARDAHAAGDSVMAENYLQHAEHYFRIISAAQAQAMPRQDQAPSDYDDDDDGDEFDGNGRFDIASRFAPPPSRQSDSESEGESQDARDARPDTRPEPREARPEPREHRPEPREPASQAPRHTADQQRLPQESGESAEARRPRGDRGDRGRGRRRGRAPDANGADPAIAPQPDMGELPAFITSGNADAAE